MQRAGGISRFPLYDGVGTARRLVDAAATATDAYSLDAFGRYMGGWANPTQNPYRGVHPERSRRGAAWGYITDTPGSGLLQLGARYYWPEVGRFVQQDPVRHEINRYLYGRNGPLVRVDPTGEVAPLIVGACVAVYKGVTVGAAIGNAAAAGYYAWAYAKCKNDALELCAHAKGRMDPGQYQQWVRTAKPGAECEELAQGAIGRGVKALGWLLARVAPSVLRARPPWD
jgi:RHS repeat-associated protein